eukprot:TRINITY_DN4921_c0_g1_i2.p1 TRINITY_DN4921_c0_g1~~TRINITY_DN4921_c0_g1_i2.p1  ORF type:complete len:533 (-),score=108.33 TRINITY_DN4921_c0_g1_i2:129-1727(-)
MISSCMIKSQSLSVGSSVYTTKLKKKTNIHYSIFKRKKSSNQQNTQKFGMTFKKSTQFPEWYSQVLVLSEMIDYYNVSGCYILRPWSFQIWETVQRFFDDQIKKDGVQNCYFPMFVTEDLLSREKEHLEGFSPEVAWVTRAGSDELKQPIAIRPTSETIMYPSYKNWIQSYKDLPLKLNQWSNVVRWEFDNPTPFLRSREFLWQEGHTAFADKESADQEVRRRLSQYQSVFEELLAVPVIPGYKSELEKFAGADYTMTLETFIAERGRAIQTSTAHHLGQNFSKMFDISYTNQEDKKEYVYQNSWGLSTRVIGTMVMMHGDDLGLVLPPFVAPIQVVIVPIHPKDNTIVPEKAQEIADKLIHLGVRVHIDDRPNMRPGKKFNHWEIKGVPLRIEIGARDIENNQVTTYRRDNNERALAPIDTVADSIPELLKRIHSDIFTRAQNNINDLTVRITSMEEFLEAVNEGKMALVPWCGDADCETNISEQSKQADSQKVARKAKSLCFPVEQPEDKCNCFACNKTATKWAYFGKSF